MNWKGIGSKLRWPNRSRLTIPLGIFVDRLEEAMKTSVRIIGVPAEIRTRHLPNRSPNYDYFNQFARSCSRKEC
jgi:hypothetical protein